MRTIFIVAILSIGFVACHKEAIHKNQSATEYFPNSIGDYWEYEVYDSSQVRDHPDYPRSYTVKVIITGVQRLADGREAMIWQCRYPDTTTEVFVRSYSDRVKIYSRQALTDTTSIYYGVIYRLPFADGERWSGKIYHIDSFFVSQEQQVITSYRAFANCFDIYHRYSGFNLFYNDHYWFKPYIGTIKIFYHQYNLGPTRIELWQLKDYGLR